MRQLFSGVYFVLLALLAAAVLGALWIAGTEAGSQWALTHAIAASGVNLHLTQPSGTLLTGLRAERLTYTDAHVEAVSEAIELNWSPAQLGQCPLALRSVGMRVLTIKIAAAPDAPPPESRLPAFSLPVPVCIEALSIGQLAVNHGGHSTTFEQVHGSLRQSGSRLEIGSLDFTQGITQVRASGTLDFAPGAPSQLRLSATTPALTIDADIDGNPREYGLTGTLRTTRRDWPQDVVHVTGRGDLFHLDAQSLQAATLGGAVSGSGHLGWRDTLALRLQLKGKSLDPALWPGASAFPGRLDAEGEIEFANGHWSTRVDTRGELRGYALKAAADVTLRNAEAELRAARVEIGPNRLTLNGSVDPEQARELAFTITAPNLKALHPDVAGALTGSGEIGGHWRQPRIKLELRGAEAAWKDINARAFDLRITPRDGERHTLSLDARELRGVGGLTAIKLSAEGTPDRHSGTLDIGGANPEIKADGRFEGGFAVDENVWRGTLYDSQLRIAKLPTWRQVAPAQLELGKAHQSLAETCLIGPRERICGQAYLDAGMTGSARLSITGFPLRRLAAWMPEARSLPGSADAALDLDGGADSWRANLNASLDSENRIGAQLGLDRGSQALSGKIEAHFDRLDWLVLAREDLDAVNGNVFADLDVGGNLHAPTLTGPVTLGNASMRLPAYGTEIRDIAMVASLATHRAVLGGQAFAGTGKVTLEGSAEWSRPDARRLELDIEGEEFEAVNLPVLKAHTAPHLKFVASPAGVSLEGKIGINPAEANLATLPTTAVRPSEDEVILTPDRTDAAPKAASLPLRTDLQLELGEKVHLSGQGIDTLLRGSLRIRENPGQPLRLFGTLQAVDGKYKAYGQNLVIEKGELYFNGPLWNPSINLRAVRKTDEVSAGLRLLGTLEMPESSVFSEPAMAETEAMSYLLTGKPLSAASQGDASLMVAAVTQLGLKGGGKLIDLIRGQTGFDVLELDSGAEYAQSALLIGKYLTARLYVQYAIKLFEETDIFSLRYRLSRNLQLEAESGTSQGIDLIYQIER